MGDDNRLIIQVLEKVDFFQGLSQEELWQLVEVADWDKATAGQKIVVAGELDLHLYVLVDGRCEVVFGNKVIAMLDPGDTFGEFGLMGERRTADVVAQGRCLLLKFNAERLNELAVTLQVKLLKRILVSLMMRLQNVNRHIFWNLPSHWKK